MLEGVEGFGLFCFFVLDELLLNEQKTLVWFGDVTEREQR